MVPSAPAQAQFAPQIAAPVAAEVSRDKFVVVIEDNALVLAWAGCCAAGVAGS